MSSLPRTTSIALLLIVLLVAVATAVLGAFGVLNYATQARRQSGALRTETVLLADQLSVSLVLPIWNFDHAQIDAVMESSMRDTNVYGLVVRLTDVKSTVQARVRDGRWNVMPALGVEEAPGMLAEAPTSSSPGPET